MTPNIINGDTGVSLSVLIGTVPLLVGCMFVGFQVRGIKKYMKKVWTIPDQKIFAERLKSHNGHLNLKVPDVDGVLSTFNGKNG